MYKIVKPLLFLIDPECAHKLTTSLLNVVLVIPLMKSIFKVIYSLEHPCLKRELFGITFKNPVGLAAGFDKNAELTDSFSHLGFGFIEIGTLTPKSQPGNPKPRLFRLPNNKGLINRMGFNNGGVDAAVERLKKRKSNLIIGGNIGKNKATPNERAIDDYLICFEKLFDYVDYFVVNVSSPNTPGLRELQEKEPLGKLLKTLLDRRSQKEPDKPVLLKIAPDLTHAQLDDILEIVEELKLDGLIVSNTTIDREGLEIEEKTMDKIGVGGLSGKPVLHKSNEVLKYIRSKNVTVPIIAVGGIMSAEDAIGKMQAGANLVQIYTGLIYKGPSLIKSINKALIGQLDEA